MVTTMIIIFVIGYVLIALTAFMSGVSVTVFLKWQQRKKSIHDHQQGTVRIQKGGGSFLADDALLMAAGGKDFHHLYKRLAGG